MISRQHLVPAGGGSDDLYNRHKYHFLGVTFEEGMGRCLFMISSGGDWPDAALTYPLGAPVPVGPGPVELRVEVNHAAEQFFWRQGGEWRKMGRHLTPA